jgi:hypothetical protein
MTEKFSVPRFATESEEADWWFENREAHGEIMAEALRGRPRMNLLELLRQRGQEVPRVSVRFDYEDIALAGKQAAARGVDLESYMRDLMHEALVKNGA